MPTTTTLKHEDYCQPRVGETEPRTETYPAERSDPDGRITSRPTITRCQECGAQVVVG